VTTSSGANYASAAPDGASDSGTLTGGSDVRQSTSGPGPFPGPNTFTPALTAAAGARGDSGLFGAINAGASAGDVAEGRLLVAGSSAASSGGTSTGINITFTTTALTTVALTFDAATDLLATTTAAGDGASAEVNASFAVRSGGTTFLNYAPGELNAPVSASGVGGNDSFSSSGHFTTSVDLAPGTYQLTLLSGAQERLQTGVEVPEPMSLALLGTGLIGLSVLRRKSKAS